MAFDFFLSYSSADRERVDALRELLTAAGASVWVDRHGIDAGTDWSAEIVAAIDSSRLVLLLLSRSAAASAYVRREISLAAGAGKPILPVYLEPVSLPAELRLHLAGLQHLELDTLGTAEAVQRIIRALERSGQREGDSSPPLGSASKVLPSGTVTFLFTDIEGSTRMWEAAPGDMEPALLRHDSLLREIIERYEGVVFKTIGDAFCAAFADPQGALAAAVEAQERLRVEPWPLATPIKVRMALHTGPAQPRGGDYFGSVLNRVARLLAIGYGGQTLVSGATYAVASLRSLAGVELRDRGDHRLKDLSQPERVYELVVVGSGEDFPPLKSLENPSLPNNLPLQATSFVGRDKELADARAQLRKTRLLTLLGSGGAGKTRLALQLAADVLEEYPDGAWLVELADFADPERIWPAVAAALRMREKPGVPLAETVIEWLSGKKLLLVLDNCEHLIEAVAAFVERVLRSSANVMLLATSRQTLGLTAETILQVPGLAVPQERVPPRLDVLLRSEGVELFLDRARAVKPDLNVSEADGPSLVTICARLDGIPLALELAAARLRSLSLPELQGRLDQRFRLLTGGNRASLPRQQTLRALIDWSYELLTADERLLLERLSVFSHGCSLGAVEAICAGESAERKGIDEWDVLDLLTSLVDKSLVFASSEAGETRYRMLETVLEYARERASVELPRLRDRHAAYFEKLAAEAEAPLLGAEAKAWLERLDRDQHNLLAALAHLGGVGTREALLAAVNLDAALTRYWTTRGLVSTARLRLRANVERLPEREDVQSLRAKALHNLGSLALWQADLQDARRCLEAALPHRDEAGAAATLNNLAIVASETGDLSSAQSLHERATAIRRDLADTAGLGSSLNNLGVVAQARGDYERAYEFYSESLAIRRSLDSPVNLLLSLTNVAFAACLLGDHQKAARFASEGLILGSELGDRTATVNILELLAELRTGLSREDTFAAAVLMGASESFREQYGTPLPPSATERHQYRLARLLDELGGRDFKAATTAGRRMSFEEAVAVAMENPAEAALEFEGEPGTAEPPTR